MSSPFGVIAAGRLPQVPDAIDVSKYLLTIPDADSVNHLIVFLTGSTPLPFGYGASVFFSWPDPSAPQSWQYLGFISNEKASAVFRLTKLRELIPQANSFAFNQTAVSHVAQIGISVEPITEINQQTPALGPAAEDFTAFAHKTAENLFNYLSSFAKSVPGAFGTEEQVVSLSTVQNWYQTYLRKLELNPGFWKS